MLQGLYEKSNDNYNRITMIRSFGIVLLALGISLSIIGFLLTNLDMTSMYWATLAGPSINIIGLMLLAFSLFKHEEKSTAH